MAVAVENIREEGMPARIERHRAQAAAFRAAFEAMGLELFATLSGPSDYSNTVTAVTLPPAIREDPGAFFEAVGERNVSISGGQAHLGGDIFRVSNMGGFDAGEIVRGVRAVGEAARAVGADVDVAAGVGAAERELGIR